MGEAGDLHGDVAVGGGAVPDLTVAVVAPVPEGAVVFERERVFVASGDEGDGGGAIADARAEDHTSAGDVDGHRLVAACVTVRDDDRQRLHAACVAGVLGRVGARVGEGAARRRPRVGEGAALRVARRRVAGYDLDVGCAAGGDLLRADEGRVEHGAQVLRTDVELAVDLDIAAGTFRRRAAIERDRDLDGLAVEDVDHGRSLAEDVAAQVVRAERDRAARAGWDVGDQRPDRRVAAVDDRQRADDVREACTADGVLHAVDVHAVDVEGQAGGALAARPVRVARVATARERQRQQPGHPADASKPSHGTPPNRACDASQRARPRRAGPHPPALMAQDTAKQLKEGSARLSLTALFFASREHELHGRSSMHQKLRHMYITQAYMRPSLRRVAPPALGRGGKAQPNVAVPSLASVMCPSPGPVPAPVPAPDPVPAPTPSRPRTSGHLGGLSPGRARAHTRGASRASASGSCSGGPRRRTR